MKNGYKKGERCVACGRTVQERVCGTCNGKGVHWDRRCPTCHGAKKTYGCAVARALSIVDYFEGEDCSSYSIKNERLVKV